MGLYTSFSFLFVILQLLWSFCYSQLGEAESKSFRLTQPIPGASKSLDYDSKLTCAESGLANSMISVAWEWILWSQSGFSSFFNHHALKILVYKLLYPCLLLYEGGGLRNHQFYDVYILGTLMSLKLLQFISFKHQTCKWNSHNYFGHQHFSQQLKSCDGIKAHGQI